MAATPFLLLGAMMLQGGATPPVANEKHPANIAVTDEGATGLAIRHFPTGLRLYTFDRDGPGVSRCLDGCTSAWPPVRASSTDGPMGDWTLVRRNDGAPQWAYKGKPVYVRYHDQPDAPSGDGVDGAWRLLGNIPPRTATPPP